PLGTLEQHGERLAAYGWREFAETLDEREADVRFGELGDRRDRGGLHGLRLVRVEERQEHRAVLAVSGGSDERDCGDAEGLFGVRVLSCIHRGGEERGRLRGWGLGATLTLADRSEQRERKSMLAGVEAIGGELDHRIGIGRAVVSADQAGELADEF